MVASDYGDWIFENAHRIEEFNAMTRDAFAALVWDAARAGAASPIPDVPREVLLANIDLVMALRQERDGWKARYEAAYQQLNGGSPDDQCVCGHAMDAHGRCSDYVVGREDEWQCGCESFNPARL